MIGIEGASIATVAGYILSNLICLFLLKKIELIIINRAVFLNSAIMVVYFLLWRFVFCENFTASVLSAVIVEGVYAYSYKHQLRKCLAKVLNRGKNSGI